MLRVNAYSAPQVVPRLSESRLKSLSSSTLNDRMDLRVHIPSTSQLSDYVTSIWEVFGDSKINETILPQGIVEMIFNLGDPMNGNLPDEQCFSAPLCFIQGVNTERVSVNYQGRQHLFGIRLQPSMVKGLLGILPSELKNTLIDLTLIKPGFNIFWHQLKEAPSFSARVKLVEEQFPVLSAAVCLRTQKLCNLFAAEGISEFSSLDKLTQQVYYSSRHLNRKAQSLFGISAEELITYKKFLHAVKLLHTNEEPLTAIAYESGFYDQAHFCRIFKSYAGITARQYRQHKSELPFHLFTKEQ
jgi:AraC-like DNA-binding protein